MTGLTPYRERLDELDEQITRLFGERFQICREIARYKLAHGVPMMAPERVAEVRGRYLERGAVLNVPSEFSVELFELLIGTTCRMEDELMAALADDLELAPDIRDVDSPESRHTSQSSRQRR